MVQYFFLAVGIGRRTLPAMNRRIVTPPRAAQDLPKAACRIVAAALLLAVASPARADGPARLLPPLLQALAIGGGIAQAEMRAQGETLRLTSDPPPLARRSIIPPRVEVPDGYEIDLVADPPRFSEPVNRDTMVAFDVLGSPQQRVSLSLSYDTEHKEIGDSSDLLRLVLEFRF
jgi:hypothetical protein